MNNSVGTCFQKYSNVWGNTFENKSIAKDHQIPKKIFELKYGKTKLLGDAKYDEIKLVLAVFASAFLNQFSIKLY